jgi:hypothetical protein
VGQALGEAALQEQREASGSRGRMVRFVASKARQRFVRRAKIQPMFGYIGNKVGLTEEARNGGFGRRVRARWNTVDCRGDSGQVTSTGKLQGR